VNIAVIGAGNIGRTLGSAWTRAGHSVVFGVRDPASDSARQAGAELGDSAQVISIDQALSGAEVVVLALPGSAVDDVLREHAGALSGKVIVDAANRAFGGSGPMNSVESIRSMARPRGIVRAFNSVGWENMAEPRFGDIQADMLFCADATGRPIGEQLIDALGMRPVYVGDLDQVHLVDALTGLWAALAYGQQRGRRLAFKVLEG
jgi:8-hydroxy-5-deazaflavin:NADPH oxidoreductase